MTLTINGETRDFASDSLTLTALLVELGMEGKPVVVELNREPVLPHEHENTTVKNGDVIEVVMIAAGG